MEETFLRRVYKTTLIMMGLIGLLGTGYFGFRWGLSFLLAAVWSIANLWVLERLLTIVFQREKRFRLAVIFFLKVPVLYGLILAYLTLVPWKISALLGGISLPYGVIVLKALGHPLLEAMGQRESLRESGKDTTGDKAH